MPKVLIGDKMSPLAAEIFEKNDIEVVVKPGLSPEEFKSIIGEFDGLAVRSSAKVTADILESAANLKVIGRAGIGVDTIDVPEATRRGIVVMNTPYGNSITTAEHAIAMMFALARQIPQASQSTHAGKWEKSGFMGVELCGKTLGIVGCGNIGSIVADRAVGLKMHVVAHDPYLTPERATKIGVEKVELDELFARADFITLHTPLVEQTRHFLNAQTFGKMKDGVRLINCARGGLIVEADLKAALDSGKVGGAALDVFETEPAKENILFGHPNVICTPHLGASTKEAQTNVALQVAEQMSAFLNDGVVTNAVNMPSISAEDAPRLRPYMDLAAALGSFAGQITEHAIRKIEIVYQGQASGLNTKPLTACVLAEILRPQLEAVNTVNAIQTAKDRGISVSETREDDAGEFQTAINVVLETETRRRNVMGTLFAGKEPRIVDIEGVPVEAALSRDMLFVRNEDRPGFIGGLGTILGKAGENISDFRLGRVPGGTSAIALVSLDAPVSDAAFEEIARLPQIKALKKLKF